jgi:hypothetical protein
MKDAFLSKSSSYFQIFRKYQLSIEIKFLELMKRIIKFMSLLKIIIIEYKTSKDNVKNINIRRLNRFFRNNEKKHSIISSIDNFE